MTCKYNIIFKLPYHFLFYAASCYRIVPCMSSRHCAHRSLSTWICCCAPPTLSLPPGRSASCAPIDNKRTTTINSSICSSIIIICRNNICSNTNNNGRNYNNQFKPHYQSATRQRVWEINTEKNRYIYIYILIYLSHCLYVCVSVCPLCGAYKFIQNLKLKFYH